MYEARPKLGFKVWYQYGLETKTMISTSIVIRLNKHTITTEHSVFNDKKKNDR
jgi:hypothetical protein